jgi:hypothetical protein
MVNDITLKTELETDPTNMGYAPFLNNAPGILAEMLNAKTGSNTKVVSRTIGIGTVLDLLGPADGAAVLSTLDTLKASNPVIKWAWHLLEKADLDVGLASTRAQLDSLATAGVLTQAQCSAIKNLAVTVASRAEVLFGNGTYVTEANIRAALATGQ